MVNLTQNSLLFPFSLTPPPPPPVATGTPFFVQKMELLEGGPKKGGMDNFSVNCSQKEAVGEDFSVDDLLVDGVDGFFEDDNDVEYHGLEAEDKTHSSVSVLPKTEKAKADNFGFPADDVFGAVPIDDVAELEWLSHFVEDSFSGYSMTCNPGKLSDKVAGKALVQANAATPVQTKARTKRARTGGRVWSAKSLSESSSSMSSSADSGFQVQAGKEDRKRKASVATTMGRRCSHCGVQKTPQWRAGPLGAKTLCNACGVRFKSGRLFPEYRPACSPTFSSERHSNNHRKVLEMRMKKDADVDVTVSAAASVTNMAGIQSF